MRKIDLESSVFNWYQLEKCKNLTFLIGNLAILEIQDRFKNYYFQKFTKENDEQIFTSRSFKISPILPKIFCDPEVLGQNPKILQKFGPT